MNDIRVGIYVRLSVDDLLEGESMSIENQKLLLTDVCFRQQWKIIDIYSDDGFTGLNFNRPDVQRLIADARSGKINLILVKDLSRFGRSHLECGYYEEVLFPSIGCRFIALNDGIDTASDSNDLLPFYNLYNEQYSIDQSRRVTTAKRARAKAGKYMGAVAPYGYEKSENGLVIDETAAETVRMVFKLRADGMTCGKIAAHMNKLGAVTPWVYHCGKENIPNRRKSCQKWTEGMVSRILKQEMYIGTTVQFKTHSLSYKNHTQIKSKNDERIRCENAHPAIIDRAIWDKVQKMWKPKKERDSNIPKRYAPLFGGLLKCADCGSTMNFKPDVNRRKDGICLEHHAYTCGTYKNGGRLACSSHWILEMNLTELVRNDLESYVQEIKKDESSLRRALIQQYCNDTKFSREQIESDLQKAEFRIRELDNMLGKAYEEMLMGETSRERLTELVQKYSAEKADLQGRTETLRTYLKAYEDKTAEIAGWIGTVQRYMSGAVLDRELIGMLIREIRIGEAQIVDGEKRRVVEIKYRF